MQLDKDFPCALLLLLWIASSPSYTQHFTQRRHPFIYLYQFRSAASATLGTAGYLRSTHTAKCTRLEGTLQFQNRKT